MHFNRDALSVKIVNQKHINSVLRTINAKKNNLVLHCLVLSNAAY